jgi:predicted RNA binding protein YcfA (HicA-like mRNA interferase family)
MSDRAKQVERMLRENGFKLERMNGHYVYVSPRFPEPIVMACTPSDHRALENLYHDLSGCPWT